MQDSNRSIRVRTKINSSDVNDRYVNVKLDNDIDIIELLSLKIDTSNFYKTHSSDYGCVAGRVLANGGVGIPNAKISVFVPLNDNENNDQVITSLYPFSYLYEKNDDGIRYNLLPDHQVSECHTPVGTFPSKRMVLDDDNVIEIFDKYYKYTTRSNDAGDYMIFGVPVGDQNIHVDIDLSDIGMLSQRPRDMIYKGYNVTQFENANKFKQDTNLDSLSQIITQNQSVYVFPFWGDTDKSEIKITRNDVDIQYKFEPTCVFLGSLITDNKSEGISKKCIPTDRMGKMDKLTTGTGTIEMIRKTPDGGVEEKQIQGNQLIDGNGTWCYQIPMNLDYFMTDEYGNFVPSDDKEKGIPTRARVRFRVSLTDFQSDYENNHLAKVLVPNNPRSKEDIDYHFGSATLDNDEASKSYRDLFWNKIYSVKQYIPRIQKGNNQRNKKFSGIKNINVNGGNNPVPYNNMRVNLTFMFVLQCAIIKAIIIVLGFVNWFKAKSSDDMCAAMGDGICPELENWYFAPRCRKGALKTTIDSISSEEQDDKKSIDYENRDESRSENYCITSSTNYLFQCIEINLAMEYEVIQFDFYNDWINGMLYIPHWFVNYRKKRSYLFGLIRKKAKLEACKEDTFFKNRRYMQQCALSYSADGNDNYTKVTTMKGCSSNTKQKCHKGKGRKSVNIFGSNGGIVHTETTLQNQSVYYFKPAEWLNVNNNNYNSKCLLFATDIILLGSLDDCDKDGLPKLFTELTSSTYVMPSNLASTNMDSQAFMYGWSDKNSRCTGTNNYRDEALVIKEQTFETYKEWIKETDDYEANYNEEKEYPITESAGIDWGYNGPNQGGNDLGNLYFPGGHFLGISCFNAEVNIKSCVNLSRICEIGSIMSQRQSFIRKNGNDFVYDYLIPNGFISKFEITDSNFRREFATLNYNGLKTKIDPETQYRKYDLKYIHPTNFNGELSVKINQSSKPYMDKSFDDSSKEKDPTTMAYKRVIEEPSNDYYYFRLGLADYESNSNELKNAKINKYMQVYYENSEKVVALPMYENSYYFYFGLNDGNTAIDRFFKDFYAPCSTADEDMSYFEVTVNDEGDVCAGDGVSVDVNITNVESPYTVSLFSISDKTGERRNVFLSINENGIIDTNVNNTIGYSYVLMHNFSAFSINGLSNGSYILKMKAKDYVEVEYPFKINDNINSNISGIDITVKNFTGASYNENTNFNSFSPTKHGYIKFSNVYPQSIYGFLVANDEKYVFVKTNSFDISSFGSVLSNYIDLSELTKLDSSKVKIETIGECKSYTVPAWKGNDTYYVFMLYPCGGQTNVFRYSDITITMKGNTDVYFGDSDLSYQLISSVQGNNTWSSDDYWPKMILESDRYSEKQKWNLKKSLFFSSSMFNGYGGQSIDVKVDDGLKTRVKGNAENVYIDKISDNEYGIIVNVTDKQISELAVPTDYELNINNFLLPTSYFTDDGAIKNYEKNGYNKYGWNATNRYNNVKLPSNVKSPYIYTVDGSVQVKLPSIYRPCYFTGVMLVNEEEGYRYYSVSVTNIITYNNKVDSLKINGTKYTDPSMLTFVEKFKGDYSQVKNLSEAMVSTDYTSGDETFSFSITEGSPGKNYLGGINANMYGDSLSCHFPCNENDDDFYYTQGIKFYYCTSTNKIVTVNGTNVIEGNDNIEIKKDSTVVITNVFESDVVKVHFREKNTGNKGIMTNLSTLDVVGDTTSYQKGKIDAKDKTVFDTVDINAVPTDTDTYRHTIIELNAYDTITIESNVEYNIFSVNHDGVIRLEQVNVPVTYEDSDNIKPKVVNKTYTPSVSGKVVIWWNKSYNAGSTFNISYSCNGKYDCGITSNKGLTQFSAKWLETTSLYLDYVEVNKTIVLGCKINGIQYVTKNTNGDETKRYISMIAQGKVPKDYSNKNTSFWNGIFGNTSFNVIDVSDYLTYAKISKVKEELKSSMWKAFNYIITNIIKQDVFAVYDKWTSIESYVQIKDDSEDKDVVIERYTNDHSNIWKYITPDLNTISMVKYFPRRKNIIKRSTTPT